MGSPRHPVLDRLAPVLVAGECGLVLVPGGDRSLRGYLESLPLGAERAEAVKTLADFGAYLSLEGSVEAGTTLIELAAEFAPELVAAARTEHVARSATRLRLADVGTAFARFGDTREQAVDP